MAKFLWEWQLIEAIWCRYYASYPNWPWVSLLPIFHPIRTCCRHKLAHVSFVFSPWRDCGLKIRLGNITTWGRRQPTLAETIAFSYQRKTTERRDRVKEKKKTTKKKKTNPSESIAVGNVPASRLKSTPHSWPVESSILRRGSSETCLSKLASLKLSVVMGARSDRQLHGETTASKLHSSSPALSAGARQSTPQAVTWRRRR